jgi:hypothetical protein
LEVKNQRKSDGKVSHSKVEKIKMEPMVLSIAPMGKRWWLMHTIDNWNDVPGRARHPDGGEPGGDFALCGPNFKGTLAKRRSALTDH